MPTLGADSWRMGGLLSPPCVPRGRPGVYGASQVLCVPVCSRLEKSPPQAKPPQASPLCCALVAYPCGALGQPCHQPWHVWLWSALMSGLSLAVPCGGPDVLVWLNCCSLNSQNPSGSRVAPFLLRIVERRFLPEYPWLYSKEECGKTVLINL